MRRLLIRPGALGDCIVSLPALEALCGEDGEVWTTRDNAPLVQFTSRVRAITETGLDLFGIEGIEPPERLLRDLRQFDQIVSWYGSNRPEFRAATEELGFPFRFFPALPEMWGDVHACDFYAAQAAELGVAAATLPSLPFPRWQGGFCAIHPLSGSPTKNWPLERFLELAKLIPMPVHFTAGPEENLEGAMRFESRADLARWLAGASLYIGNDTGVTHVAAALGVPTIALFGTTNPIVWAPRGPKVQVVQSTDRSMQGITIEAVLEACKAFGITP